MEQLYMGMENKVKGGVVYVRLTQVNMLRQVLVKYAPRIQGHDS